MGSKTKVFVDADDTILLSSETIIDILNEKYNISPQKTIEDLKDWGYRSIYKGVSGETISEIYDSDEFFSRVKVNSAFEHFYEQFKDVLEFYIVTKGTFLNLKKKKEYFANKFPEIKFIGCPHYFEEENFSKGDIDMKNGIQIDDRADCLTTNAGCKILLKNNRKVLWNNYEGGIDGNVYVMDTWNEVETCVNFFL
jgi:5'(3')-deoxyribonucleotidase